MSITDELREYACIHQPYKSELYNAQCADEITAIADRIDAEHEKAVASAVNDVLYYANDKDMAELGWIRLPVDANGEYLHIGDRVENNERVARIVLTDGSWEPSVYIEKLPNVLHEYFCNEISHYHAPAVEDVLREFVTEFNRDDSELCDEEIIERFAAKLRLKGDE
jgi:hypothetical protein